MKNTASKTPTLYREPIIPELVIDDLKDMLSTGHYDHNVLLWLQDGYANKAFDQNMMHLGAVAASLAASGDSPEEIKRQRNGALAAVTREVYSTERAAGRGADLNGYIAAAKTFFETESARYGGHLKDVAEYIQKALANGEQPDIERYAKETYTSMAKMSGAINQLNGLSGKVAAQAVSNSMKAGIEAINFTTIGDQPTEVGRILLNLVDKISKNPNAYIEFKDPKTLPAREHGPWDFEPIHRQGFNLNA